jgi:hypothetical protein
MLGLPKSTELKKQLPKNAIYIKFNMSTAAKEKFDADVKRIVIVNEISPTTTTVPKGELVEAIFVLLVSLKRENFNVKNIELIPKLIHQNMLLILEYEGKAKLSLYHTQLLQTEWKPTEAWTLTLKGLNLDTVWENVIRKIADHEELEIWSEELSPDENIAKILRIEKLKKDIEHLGKKARKELQHRKKFELVQAINGLRKELEGNL